MWLLFVLLPTFAMAQEPDLSGIRNLENQLPDFNRMSTAKSDEIPKVIGDNKYSPLVEVTNWEKIKNSGTAFGSVETGSHFVRLEDNLALKNQRSLFVRYYQLEDEQGYKYVINADGSTTYRIESRFIEPIGGELALYEPPLKYTPAPSNKLHHYYDKDLSMAPEIALYIGHIDGDFMRDLFNDKQARSGVSSQYALHYFTKWNLPVKVGAAVHYEQATYNLTGGKMDYSSFSFGPQLKTKDLDVAEFLYRLQLQIRMGPWAKAQAELQEYGPVEIKFNSTDLMASLEHPMKNQWGEWLVGAYYQAQWLNIRDAEEIVSIRASNRLNNSFGLYLGQVFE